MDRVSKGKLLFLMVLWCGIPALGQTHFKPASLQDGGELYFELGRLRAGVDDIWYRIEREGRIGYYACDDGIEKFVGVMLNPPLKELTVKELTQYVESNHPDSVKVLNARRRSAPVYGIQLNYRCHGKRCAVFVADNQGAPFMLQVEGADPEPFFTSFQSQERPPEDFQTPELELPERSPFERLDASPTIGGVIEQWSRSPELPVTPRAGSGPAPVAFESVVAKRGGPPFHVLNIRVTLRNQTTESLKGVSILVYARDVQKLDWYKLTEWSDLPRFPPGQRLSRDYVGRSDEIASSDFRVKVIVTTPKGSYEREVGPAGAGVAW